MPHNKRKRVNSDPTKSDSDDDDYAEVPEARKTVRRAGPKKQRKKARTSRHGRDASDEDEDEEFSGESFEEDVIQDSEPEVVELNQRGRPKRSAAAKIEKYEDKSDSEGSEAEIKAAPPRSKVVRLVLNPSKKDAPARSTRATSIPQGRRGLSAEPLSAGIRKSSRLHHDEDDPIVALSNSGRHAEIISKHSGSPEGARSSRPTRGGKGIKAPADTAEDERPPTGQGAGKTISKKPRGKTVVTRRTGRQTIEGADDGAEDEPAEAENEGENEGENDDEAGDAAETDAKERTADAEADNDAAEAGASDADDDEDGLPVTRGRGKVGIPTTR